MTLAVGTRLGPYEILAPLAAGGMGVVYRARDARLEREVAIKALPADLAGDSERRTRFEREARALAALNHPNIAILYGLEEVDGVPYLVLELVEGETLAQRLERGALPVREALELCTQLAAAIEAAHERGIIHRDLKPGNVMRTPAGRVKVLDFGLATAHDPDLPPADLSQSPTRTAGTGLTAAGTILGTAAYMSPEQARGMAVDRRTDVWSFGCILFETLSGRPAFTGRTAADLIARILEREPDWRALPASLPARVLELLRRCLRKDAADRPRDIRDVRLALAEACGCDAPADTGCQESIAVLPFAHASGPDDEYFADGITEEIMNALAQLEGLRVAARTSSFAFKGKRQDLREVGETLGVSNVLEGSVRRSGERLRITAQLVNAADGYQLWSERYDRERLDVFAVQDEIAGAIATKLKLTLVAGAACAPVRRGTAQLEAYDAFLKGRALQNRRGRFILEALPYFERAVELDPGYADAHGLMADSYRLMATYGAAAPDEVMPKARAAAERALALDPDSVEAHATLADIHAQYDRDYESARRSWARALAIDPRHTRARCERALWGLGTGALAADAAIAAAEQAVADDPLNAWAIALTSTVLGLARRSDDGLAAARRAVEADADSYYSQWSLFAAHVWAGQPQQALGLAPALLAASGRHPWTLGMLGLVHARLGDAARARAVHDELVARARIEFVAPSWRANTALAAGLEAEALAEIERAVEERDPFSLLLRVWPAWDPLRAHPRFEAQVARMGFLGVA